MLFQIVTFIDLTLCIICYPGRSLETDVRLLGDNVSRCSRSARGRGRRQRWRSPGRFEYEIRGAILRGTVPAPDAES